MNNAQFEKLIFANCAHTSLIALCKTFSSPPSRYVCETCAQEFSQAEFRDGWISQGFHKSETRPEVMR